MNTEDDNCQCCVGTKCLFTNFQADNYGSSSGGGRKKVACTAGAIISLSIFCKLGGNEAKFGHAVNLWVGTRIMLK